MQNAKCFQCKSCIALKINPKDSHGRKIHPPPSGSSVKEVIKKKAEIAIAAEGVDDSEFSPPNSKKDKKAAKNKLKYGFNSNQSNGRQKPPPSFTLHAPVPDLQRKITTFATVTKATSSKSATIPNALPVPQLL